MKRAPVYLSYFDGVHEGVKQAQKAAQEAAASARESFCVQYADEFGIRPDPEDRRGVYAAAYSAVYARVFNDVMDGNFVAATKDLIG